MSINQNFAPESGRYTGLPVASHAARFALAQGELTGLVSLELFAHKCATKRFIPLGSEISQVVSHQAAVGPEYMDWPSVTGRLVKSYREAVEAVHERQIEPDSTLVKWLISLDNIPPTDRRWRKLEAKAFKYGCSATQEKLRWGSSAVLNNVVSSAILEGAMTTGAYLDVIAKVAARERPDDVDAAMDLCRRLIKSSAPFAIEMSGFGKAMNDVVLKCLSQDPASFSGYDKYLKLSFDPEKLMIKSFKDKPDRARFVGLTDEAIAAIEEDYAQVPVSRRDPIQLFGCPAHAYGGVLEMYRDLANIGYTNGIFVETISKMQQTS